MIEFAGKPTKIKEQERKTPKAVTREAYVKMTEPYRRDPARARRLQRENRLLVLLLMAAYAGLLLWLLVTRNPLLVRAICVPLDGFLAVSVFRFLRNRSRPYETFDLPPVIPREGKGKSFPSRHVFSAAVIAVTTCMIPGLLIPGVILLALSLRIARIRVISGVHYPSDVIAAIAIALAAGWIGFCVI